MIKSLSTLYNSLLAFLATAFITIATTLDTKPLIPPPSFSQADAATAKKLLQNIKESKDPTLTERSLSLSESEAKLVLNHLLNQQLKAGVNVKFSDQVMRGVASIRLSNPGAYLNIAFTVVENAGSLALRRLQVGGIELHAELSSELIDRAMRHLSYEPSISGLLKQIESIYLKSGSVQLHQSRPGTHYSLLGDEAAKQITEIYEKQIERALAEKPESLSQLLKPLFATAASRSITHDPIAENKALLNALGLYAAGPEGRALLGRSSKFGIRVHHWVTLQQRQDLARHFLISAAVAGNGDRHLANAIGLYKELQDSRGGSGFSFADLASDRAGARFGTLAVQSPRLARRFQLLLSAGLNDAQLLPPIKDLPENLSEKSFKRAFNDIGSARYERMIQTIDKRIGALALYRQRQS